MDLHKNIVDYYTSTEISEENREAWQSECPLDIHSTVHFLNDQFDSVEEMSVAWETEYTQYFDNIAQSGNIPKSLNAYYMFSIANGLKDFGIETKEQRFDFIKRYDQLRRRYGDNNALDRKSSNVDFIINTGHPMRTIEMIYRINFEQQIGGFTGMNAMEADTMVGLFLELDLSREQQDKVFESVTAFISDQESKGQGEGISIIDKSREFAIAISRGIDMASPQVRSSLSFIEDLRNEHHPGPNPVAKLMDVLMPYMDIDLDQEYSSEWDVYRAVMQGYNEGFTEANSKEISHFINEVHDDAGLRKVEDPRPRMLDELTPDAMIQLIADGGAHLPMHYYLSDVERTRGQQASIDIGAKDYMIAMYTSTFNGIDKRLETFREENPEEYDSLLSKDQDRLVRFTFMLARFSRLSEHVQRNPELFIKPIQEVLMSEEKGVIDELMLSSGIISGLESESSESYQKLVHDLYWEYFNRGDKDGLSMIAYLVKEHSNVFDAGPYGETLQRAFVDYSTPEAIPLPDWSQEKEIRVVLFYNKEDIANEGNPGVLSELPKHGYTIVQSDTENLIWKLERQLPGGRTVNVTVTTEPLASFDSDERRPHLASQLFHSYHADNFFTPVPEESKGNWDNTVFYNGFCGSARYVSRLHDKDYNGPQIGDADIANGWVNIIASMDLIDIFALENPQSWKEFGALMPGYMGNFGIKGPEGEVVQKMSRYIKHERGRPVSHTEAKYRQEMQRIARGIAEKTEEVQESGTQSIQEAEEKAGEEDTRVAQREQIRQRGARQHHQNLSKLQARRATTSLTPRRT